MNINGFLLKTALQGLSILTSSAKIDLTGTGLTSAVADPGNICMAILNINSSVFTDLNLDQPIGLDVVNAYSILKDIKSDEPVQVEILEKEKKIKFSIGNLTYSLALFNVDAIKKTPKKPVFDMPVRIVIDAEGFKQGIKAAMKVSDDVVFKTDDEGLTISSSGSLKSMSFFILKDELEIISYGSAQSMFTLDYLSDIVKVIPKDANVQLSLGSDAPCSIKFNILGEEETLEFLIAPRVVDHA